MTSHTEQCSVTPGCRGQIGVLRAKGKTTDHTSHRFAYGGSDTYLFILDGEPIRVGIRFKEIHRGKEVSMKSFERYMLNEHKGRKNAVTSREIEARFHCKGAEVRRMVNELRCGGVPICSCNKGYYYATNDQEVKETVAHLEGRIKKIRAAQDGMKRLLNNKEG